LKLFVLNVKIDDGKWLFFGPPCSGLNFCVLNVKIDDAQEEKSSVHLKEVIKTGEVSTVGFGNEESVSASAAVNINVQSVCYLRVHLCRVAGNTV